MSAVSDRRRALLTAALRLPPAPTADVCAPRAARVARQLARCWPCCRGDAAAGLPREPARDRCLGRELPARSDGQRRRSASAPTPWGAVQQAAWVAMNAHRVTNEELISN